jgi:ribosome-associated protein YbcJ (S4-like RNA binding protein)
MQRTLLNPVIHEREAEKRRGKKIRFEVIPLAAVDEQKLLGKHLHGG